MLHRRLAVSAFAACVALAPAQTPLELRLVAAGLTRPVAIVAPPGDLHRLFVIEQPGRVRVIRDGVLLPTPFLDLPASVVSFGGELGLLGLAFHPDYASNGRCYIYYTGYPWPTAHVDRVTVSATDPDVADPASRTAVLATPLIYGNHNSGMLAFDPDGYLRIAIGDGGSQPPLWPEDPFDNAQRTDTLLGKLLRIDVDHPAPPLAYSIPADNPFAGSATARGEIWDYGLRNPWRFSFDRLTGDLYIGDVGGLEEEIDFEPAGSPGGRNYGWACMAGNHCNTASTVCTCNAPALTAPLHAYATLPSAAVIGGYVYRGIAAPDWRGAYFFADNVRNMIWALRHTGGTVTQLLDLTAGLTAPTSVTLGGVTTFGEDGYGELHLADLSGNVYRIAPIAPVVTGVQPYGVGTPGCSGPHTLAAESSPVVGNPAFALRTGQAPANGFGVIAFASAADVAGSDPLGFGVVVHVDVGAPFLLLLTTASDGAGVGRFTFAIPPTQSLVGLALFAQTLWLWSPAQCSPSPTGWSSSPGLAIVLAP